MFHYFISPVSPTVNLRELFCDVYSYQLLEFNPCGKFEQVLFHFKSMDCFLLTEQVGNTDHFQLLWKPL